LYKSFVGRCARNCVSLTCRLDHKCTARGCRWQSITFFDRKQRSRMKLCKECNRKGNDSTMRSRQNTSPAERLEKDRMYRFNDSQDPSRVAKASALALEYHKQTTGRTPLTKFFDGSARPLLELVAAFFKNSRTTTAVVSSPEPSATGISRSPPTAC